MNSRLLAAASRSRSNILRNRRGIHTFYDDRVQAYAAKELRKLTLPGTISAAIFMRPCVCASRGASSLYIYILELLRWGEKPVTEEKVIKSAQFALHELPVRLARRIQELQRLPFIVGTNPYIRQIQYAMKIWSIAQI